MPYMIVNNKNEPIVGRGVYKTEKGAKMGYKASLEGYVQDKYLYNKSLNYKEFVAWVFRRNRYELLAATPLHSTHVQIKQYVDDFNAEYHIKEVKIV